MNRSIVLGFALALAMTPAIAQQTILNPAISPETITELQLKISELETRLTDAKGFVAERKPDLIDLQAKITNADDDTQKIIDELNALVDQFKTGSDIQVAVEASMQDVKGYIDKFRAGSPAQQAAAQSLTTSLESMEATDGKRNEVVGNALAQVRKLEAMKGDLVALRIAGAFEDMAKLYDEMVSEFETTVDQTIDVSDAIESLTVLPVQ